MSIAAPPEASCSITHFRRKKDFFYIIKFSAGLWNSELVFILSKLNRSDEQNAKSDILELCYFIVN